MSIYAYIRVSTQVQTLENQTFEITQWANRHNAKIDKWISESVSGTISLNKRKLGHAIRKMKEGDMIICTEISRLGRNMLMIMGILNECSQRGIRIVTIKDNFNLTDSINSKIIAFAFALAAEIERNLISQRTKEALALRKQNGIKLGRPRGHGAKILKIYDDYETIKSLRNNGITLSFIARTYNVHRNTLAKCLKECERTILSSNHQ